MTTAVRLQEPLVLGERRVYPVVAEAWTGFDQGGIASLVPLALIIEEGGEYTVALLGIDSVAALAERLGAAYLHPL
jgi:hypothetical protein